MRKALSLVILAVGAASVGAASVAIAANPRTAEDRYVAPVAEHVMASEGGYGLLVHPGFSSVARITNAAGTVNLYKQSQPFDLPEGRSAGPDQHVIRLTGGEAGRDLGLVVNDPQHQIARITIELYSTAYVPGTAREITETLVVTNDPILCPPMCD